MSGIRRESGIRPQQKAPVLVDDLRRMIITIPETTAGLRDRALLLIAWGAALRRSEAVALDVADVTASDVGLLVTIKRAKTDQEGEGAQVAIHRGRSLALCPVAALQAWQEASGIVSGPIFVRVLKGGQVTAQRIAPEAVADIVKQRAIAVGLDPASLGGHSLRAGLATSAALAGASLESIMRQTRHKSVDVARSYVRVADLWRGNITANLL